MSHNPAVAYRPDIDGLRAIAVLSVVFYHFGFGLPGGFVGVDVFFVISGYLITGIIQREIELGTFTFTKFYERRIRRIFPALFTMLAITQVAGYVIMLPTDLILLGKSTLVTLFFGSNIFFWRTSGYFDTNSELNPLLHTWSLSVEEQFYIGLPLLLLAIWRFCRSWLKPILLLTMVASFVLGLCVMQIRPTAAFYLSPFRAWELLAGSILAVGVLPSIQSRPIREGLAWIALVVLLFSLWYVRPGSDFPGWQAWLPVIATVSLIHVHGSGQTIVSRLLSLRPVVFIGLISYSLYLWHWPILYFEKYLNALEPIGQWAYAGVILSLLLAVASYRYVETPLRDKKNLLTYRLVFPGAVMATFILATVSVGFWKSSGFPSRFPMELVELDLERIPVKPYINCDFGSGRLGRVISNAECIIGRKSEDASVLLWGDSHARSIAPAFDRILSEKGISGLILANNSCLGLIGVKVNTDHQCPLDNDDVIRYIAGNDRINTVILHSYWAGYTGKNSWKLFNLNEHHNKDKFSLAMLETVEKLTRLGKKVVIVGPVPTSSTRTIEIVIRKRFGFKQKAPITYREFQEITYDFYHALNKTRKAHSFSYLDLSVYYCVGNVCNHTIGNKNIYSDSNHLSLSGSLYLVPFLRKDKSLNDLGK